MRRFPMFAFLACAAVCACTSPSGIAIQPAGGELVANGSFEPAGPSLTGWTITAGDDSAARVVLDHTALCGSYALAMETVWGIAYAETTVPAAEGRHGYRLQVAARATGRAGNIGLSIAEDSASEKLAPVKEGGWAVYTLDDTLSVAADRHLRIRLYAGFSQLLTGTTWYDCVSLKRLD